MTPVFLSWYGQQFCAAELNKKKDSVQEQIDLRGLLLFLMYSSVH